MNKKGSVQDGAIMFIVLFVLIIVTVVAAYTYGVITNGLISSGYYNAADTTTLTTASTKFPTMMDGMLAFFLVVLWITSLVLSFYLDNSPVFFVIFLLLAVVSLIGLFAIGTFFTEIKDNSAMSTFFTSFPITSFIIDWSGTIMILYFASLGAALYAKSQNQGAY